MLGALEARRLLKRTCTKKQLPGDARTLLLIAQSLPPFDNGGVHRPLSFVRYAADNGWNVRILTRPPPDTPSPMGLALAKQMPDNIEIRYMTEWDIFPTWNLFPRIDGSFLRAVSSAQNFRRWVTDEPPDVIAATGPAFDTFIAGRYLAAFAHAPLVLDYRDEWALNPTGIVHLGNADRYWEQKCLNAADHVFFTTETMRTLHLEVFGGSLGPKSSVLHNGWETADHYAAEEPIPARPKGTVTQLVYVGFMGDWSLPGPFLADLTKAIHDDPAMETATALQFIGHRYSDASEQFRAFSHPDMLDLRGLLPKDQANAAMRAADATLLITPEVFARYIPGKLYDYLAAGVPVLVHGHFGEAAKIVTENDAGYFVEAGDADGLARAIKDIQARPWSSWQGGKRAAFLETHTREYLAQEFYRKLDRLLV